MSKKLLLADDSITIQKVIQITFAHEDYELTITDNGDAALAKAQEIMPDLIMTDIYMPGKNGFELTHAIKQDPVLRHVPVLLLTGSFEPFDEDKALSCKADAWIEKPFESQSLIDKVAELISAARFVTESTAAAADSEPFAADDEPAGEEDAFETPMAAVEEPAGEEEAFETPMAAVEEPFEEDAFETPMAADVEPVSTEPEEVATLEGYSAEIPFQEEVPAAETVAVVDDWSAFAVEKPVAAPFVEDTFAISEDFSFSKEEPSTEIFEDFSFSEEESAAEIIEDFSFTDEAPVSAADFAPVKEAQKAEAGFDDFGMDDDEIMPLDDEDILGAEDLEPIMPEQTLASWSRDESAVIDAFAESLEEVPAFGREPALEAPLEPDLVEETAAFYDDEPETDAINAFEESAEPSLADEPAPVVKESEPAVVDAALSDVEAQVSVLSEEAVEKIIEKIVTQVVEKLAGQILERVAWDVVPDLAESLIREEIRKIKDAAA
ncbi:MAG: response regulator [Desulfuromonadales bacterium]